MLRVMGDRNVGLERIDGLSNRVGRSLGMVDLMISNIFFYSQAVSWGLGMVG